MIDYTKFYSDRIGLQVRINGLENIAKMVAESLAQNCSYLRGKIYSTIKWGVKFTLLEEEKLL